MSSTDPSPASRPGLPPAAVFWLPTVTFLLHTLEELPDFPIWVSRHFAAMSVLEFAAIHIPLIGLVLWASVKAQDPASPGWRFMAYAFQWQFAFNALFHLGAATVFQDYSPGMVTAATVALPATVYMTRVNARSGLISPGRAPAAIGVGAAIAAAAIGVLFV